MIFTIVVKETLDINRNPNYSLMRYCSSTIIIKDVLYETKSRSPSSRESIKEMFKACISKIDKKLFKPTIIVDREDKHYAIFSPTFTFNYVKGKIKRVKL